MAKGFKHKVWAKVKEEEKKGEKKVKKLFIRTRLKEE